jgi:O-glycosyl hydrolase
MLNKLRIVLIISLVLGLIPFNSQPALAAAVVNPGNIYVANFEGWGTSLAWWANVLGGWSDANRNAIADLVFSSSGLGLNIVRYNIGGSSASQAGMGPGKLVRSYINSNGTYDWTVDANQRWVLSAAMSRGANLTEAFSNSPPWFMTIEGDTRGRTGCGDNLISGQETAFADYLTEVTKHFRDSWGVTFRNLEPLNEPNATWWCGPGVTSQEGAHIGRPQQDTVVQAVGASLVAKGLTGTKASAPDESGSGDTIGTINAYSTTAKNYLTQINTHTYGGTNTDRTNLKNLAVSLGKRLWMSEVDGTAGTVHNHNAMDAPLSLAVKLTDDINYLRPNAWVFWQVVEEESNQANQNKNWGAIHANFSGSETYWLTKKYYMFGNYTKFIRPGYQIIASGDAKSVAAYDPSTSKLVIVSYNNTASGVAMTYDLSGFTTATGPATPHRTSATENLAQLANITVTNRQFSTTLAANSITTFVVTGVSGVQPTLTPSPTPTGLVITNDNTTGTGQNQFNYTGTWSYGSQSGAYQGDNHWSSVTNNAYQVAFTGTKVQIYSAKANNHGIFAVSIDGGAETNVDLYAATRADQVLVWTSPNLTSGSHTVKVRVTGTKNASSTGAVIVADRVDTSNAGGPTPTPTNTPSPGPIAWYQFEGNANDSSGNGKHGTLVNGPVFVAGKVGQAVDLDATNDYVSLPAGLVNGLTNFSVSTWVKLDTISNNRRIFDFGNNTTVYMYLTPRHSSNNLLQYGITTSGTGGTQRTNGNAALPTGVWKHVAVTQSGNTVTLYVDGAQVGQNTGTTLNPNSLGNTLNNWLARSQWSTDPYLDGQLDQFRLYNRALSAAEVLALFQTP